MFDCMQLHSVLYEQMVVFHQSGNWRGVCLLTLCVLNKDCNEFCFLMAIFASINMCLVVSAFISYYFIVEYPLLFWGLVSWCVIMSVFWILFGCVFTNCQ